MHPSFRQIVAAAGIALVGLVALAAPASAHVTVNPDEAPKGGFTKLAFRVPTERDDASTTKVEVAFPEQPIPFVSVRPHPGWTVEVERGEPTAPTTTAADGDEEAGPVSTITWTADSDADGIAPGQFDEFEVSVGPLPTDVDQLVFKTLQTYDDGEVVSWIETPTPGGPEPARPAPTLTLVAAPVEGDGGEAAAAGPSQDDVDSARTIAVVGVVLGLVGIAVGAVALVVARSRRGPSA
jgi:uncharacterized protein